MLRKDIAELVAKSSYIKSVKLKNGCWEFVYSDYNAGKLKKFKLPIRTTQPMLVRKLSSIKKQIGYKDRGLSSSERAYFVITSQFNDDGTFTDS